MGYATNPFQIICIDLGGTKLEIGVMENDLLVHHHIQPTATDFISQLTQSIDVTLRKHSRVSAISIGVPGPVKDDVMCGSKPLNYQGRLDISRLLSRFDLPIIVRNDLQMAAYEELQNGVGRDNRNFCLVSISTGIGVAAVINRKVLPVRTEMGHTVLDRVLKPSVPCMGHSNCWVSLASGAAVEKRYSTREGRNTATIMDTLPPKEISRIRSVNANGFGAIVNAYDPDVIAVMGSFGLARFDLIIPTPREVELFTMVRPAPPIVRSACGKGIGVRGAYYAALHSSQPENHS